MARPKKDSVSVSIRMESSIANQLDKFCEISGQSKTTAIERALELYITKFKSGISLDELANILSENNIKK